VGTLVNHQVVGFGEASLAELAHEFTLWPHFTTEIRPTVVIINSHYRKHFGWLSFFVVVAASFSLLFALGEFSSISHTRPTLDCSSREVEVIQRRYV
jgi:hypothetical protein